MNQYPDYICSECHKPCVETVIDDGIGAYEFWGAKGFDSRPAVVSDCCEATIIDDNGDKRNIGDLQEEYEEARAEALLDVYDDDIDFY